MSFRNQVLEIFAQKNILKHGNFITKSGRRTSFFINMGEFNSGKTLSLLAKLYAEQIVRNYGASIQNIFGPSYKGISLAVSVSYELSRMTGKDVSFTFDRKEVKDHGERGMLVGYQYKGGERVVIVEDILTSGMSLRQSCALLRKLQIDLKGAVVGVDRGEPGQIMQSAKNEMEKEKKCVLFRELIFFNIISF